MSRQGPFTKWIRLVLVAAMATALGVSVSLSGAQHVAKAAGVAPETLFMVDGDPAGPNDFAEPYGPGTTPAPGNHPTTGIYYNVRTVDQFGAVDPTTWAGTPTGCDLPADDTAQGGTDVGDGPVWPLGGPNPNSKTDLNYIDTAAEKVDVNGQIIDILYVGYEKCGGQGTWQTVLYLDDGDGLAPTEGDLQGDYLFIFDFNPSDNSVTFVQYRLVGGAWTQVTSNSNFIKGFAGQDYGEVALNLTGLRILGDGGDECSTVVVGGQAGSITGGSLNSQMKDLVEVVPLTISNCGDLDVQKVSDPAGVTSPDLFHYAVDQGAPQDAADIDIVHDDTLAVNLNGSGNSGEPDTDYHELDANITAGGTHNWTSVNSQPDYTIAEDMVPSGWALERIECTYTDIFVSPPALDTVVVYETVGGVGSYTGNEFLVPPSSFANDPIPPTSCTITNATSGVIIEKQGTGDAAAGFTFDAFDNDLASSVASPVLSLTEQSALIAVTPGNSVTITETNNPSGWNLVSVVCSYDPGAAPVEVWNSATNGGVVPTFDTVAGEVITCIFTNNQNPRLTLVKEVTNDNGGTATAADWTLTATGSGGFSGTTGVSQDVSPGSYDLSESGPALYTGSDWSCTAGQVDGDTVAVGYGDDVTCTITNDDDAPSLTLVKQVVNDNGGVAAPGDFTLTAAGYSAASPLAGSYDLSESGPAGYTQTSLTCDNSTGQVTSVTLGLGEDVTCTFVNNDDAPSLTLIKRVVNDNGGTAVPGDWTLTAAGYDPLDPQAGTYDLSESGGPAGYTQTSLTCDNSTGQVTSVMLGLGEDVSCIFVNDDVPPGLTLVKRVVNDNGGTAVPGDWTLTAAGYDPADPQTGTFALSESGGPAGYTQTSLTCDNSTGQVTSVTLGLNQAVVCTFVNDDDAPSLTLVKEVVNDNGGTSVPADWTLMAAGYDAAAPQTGAYDLSESGPAGYTLTSLTCDNSTGQVTSVTLGLGDDVTCTFVNDDDAPSLTLVKEVVNDNGGTSVPADWTLMAAGYDAAAPQTGAYDLSESGPAGYVQTSLTCDDATGQVTSVTLGLGDDVTCTFVNDDTPPGLTLVKQVVNDNGGTAVAGDFTLTAAGYDSTNPQAGTYDLSETGPDGYTQISLTCDNSTGQVTSATVGLNEAVVCTFVNDDDAPSLTLIKEAISDDGGNSVATDWTLTADGPTGISGQTGVTSDDTFSAGRYDLSEAGPDGYLASDWVCLGGIQADADTVVLGAGESATCTIVNDDEPVDLELTKDDGGVEAVAGGAPFDYTLSMQNIGTRDLDLDEPVTLTDTLPAGLTWVSFPANCAQAAQTLTCDIDPALLPAGGTAVVLTAAVQAEAGAPSGLYVNKASVTTQDDPSTNPPCPAVGDNNVDCEETPVDREGGIQIIKTDDVADGVTVQPGGAYSYELVATNTGVSTILPGLVVTDDLPAQLGLVSAVGGAGWSCNAVDPIECTYAPALAPGGSAPSITVTVEVVPGASGTSIVNVAEVIGAIDRDCATDRLIEAFDPACNEVTDDDDEITPLNPNADLSIVKTASAAVLGAGGGFDWILDITNNGPGIAVNVVIGDVVPSAVTVTGVTSSDFSCGNTGNDVECTVASLAVGASGTVSIQVTVPLTAESGTVDNVGSVESDTPDPDLTNNSDDASVDIVAQAAPTTTMPVTLPQTGSDATGGLVQAAFLLFGLGLVIMVASRRRRENETGLIA